MYRLSSLIQDTTNLNPGLTPQPKGYAEGKWDPTRKPRGPIKIETGKGIGDSRNKLKPHVVKPTTSTSIICSEPGASRRLGAFIKANRCDQTGVAHLKEGNLLHSDPKAKADVLNRQFASVFTSDNTSDLPDLGHSPNSSMNDIIINNQGIVKLLKNLNSHKATGPDGIPARLLKETAAEIAPAITLLYQASLNQVTVPSAWKRALVVPTFKKGNRSSPANYRPISLTAILSKLCEHVIHSAIINHFTELRILSDAQHGIRKTRSCDTQLILTINDLARGIEDRGQTDIMLLDFAKAFDKVSHRLLLHKMQN